METMLMVAPDGTSGEVLMKDVPEAFRQKFERGYRMRAPNGKTSVVPLSLVDAHLKGGFKIVPSENSEA